MNVIAIVGRLTADPELKKTNTGTSVCTINVAVDRSYAKQGEERKSDFFTCVSWKNQAEFISKYFRKGNYIALDGEMQSRQYENKNGIKITAWELIVAHASFCESKKEPSVSNTPEYYEVPDEEGMPF